jgi:parvulin-like peptidyl-prolyl isomerase
MFEVLKRYSQTLFMVILLATVVAFGLSWGPGSRGCSEGKLAVTHVAQVYGRTISETEYTSTFSVLRRIGQRDEENPAITGAIRQGALDGLIERELLAHEAERLGFRVTDDDVNAEFRKCRFYLSVGNGAETAIGVQSGPIPPMIISPRACSENNTTEFSYEAFERLSRRMFERTVPDLRESTRREILAQRMRESVVSTVQLSDEELWRDYQRTHDQMAVKYLRFTLAFYRDLVRDDNAADVAAWAGQHAEDVNRMFERRRDTLRGLQRELRVRHILLSFPEGATDAQKIETRAKAAAVAARLAAGEDFVRLARLYSGDPGSWRTGGDMGWQSHDAQERLVAPFRTAMNALAVNAISAPVETEFGLHIIQVTGAREGDVPEGEAKRDIARTLYREARAAELAGEAARASLARIRGGADIATVARDLRAAALREFYRGDVPAAETLAGNVTLAPVERTDLDAPELKESEQFTRNGMVLADVDRPDVLTQAAFQLTDAQPLGGEALHVGDDWFILRFKDGSRTTATREEFARQRQEQLSQTSMLGARQRQALVLYITHLRQEAEHAGQVRLGNSERIRAPQPGANAESQDEDQN